MTDPTPVKLNVSTKFAKGVRQARTKLERETLKSIRISDRNIGLVHTGRQRRAIFVLSKLVAHNLSIMGITDSFLQSESGFGLLDHFSIATLGRATIDAALMTMYISAEGLTADSWDLRRQILFLHDLSSRKRFLGSLGKAFDTKDRAFLDSYPEVKNDLVAKIDCLANKLGYSSERIKEFKKGQIVFIDGARGAAREAEWDVQLFDFHQSYLSMHVHSHPVSFIRAHEHDIQFEGASKFQIEFVELVIEAVRAYNRSVNKRMAYFSDVEKGDPIGHVE